METTDENRIREIVRDELTNFAPQKKKRAPNKWQIFLKDCVKEQNKELAYPDKVKACSVKYKENKGKVSNDPPSPPPPPPEQSAQSIQQAFTQQMQYTPPAQPVQPVQPIQYTPSAQLAQPTYHTQQLTEDDIERLIRLNNEKLAKMAKRQ